MNMHPMVNLVTQFNIYTRLTSTNMLVYELTRSLLAKSRYFNLITLKKKKKEKKVEFTSFKFIRRFHTNESSCTNTTFVFVRSALWLDHAFSKPWINSLELRIEPGLHHPLHTLILRELITFPSVVSVKYVGRILLYTCKRMFLK